jgi:hypothetical protein
MVLAKTRDNARVMDSRQRQGRLAHAECPGHDDWPIQIHYRFDKLIQPIHPADHLGVGWKGRRDDRGELREVGRKIGVNAEPNGRDARRPWVSVSICDENEMLVAKAGESPMHPVEQAADVIVR